MRAVVARLVVAFVVLAVAVAVAYADGSIVAGPGNQFVNGNITIDQGAKVTFTNGDTVDHDVTAKAAGPDGRPLFKSERAGPGTSQPVVGTEYLTTGTYDYICSIHPFMTGTITVSSNGTPAPRPGGGDGGGGGSGRSQTQSSDTTAPTITVKVLDTKRSAVRKRRALQLSLTTDEAATVAISASSGKTVVASGSAQLAKAGTKKVSVKLTKAGLRMTKRSGVLRVTVSARATDAAGNASTGAASGRMR